MLQSTFNNYLNAATQASVDLTDSLLQDITSGNRYPTLNGETVTLKEKEIAAYFLDRWVQIFQEYTLTDLAGNDNSNNPAENRLTRSEMKELLRGINRLSGLGLNSSEDFLLDN